MPGNYLAMSLICTRKDYTDTYGAFLGVNQWRSFYFSTYQSPLTAKTKSIHWRLYYALTITFFDKIFIDVKLIFHTFAAQPMLYVRTIIHGRYHNILRLEISPHGFVCVDKTAAKQSCFKKEALNPNLIKWHRLTTFNNFEIWHGIWRHHSRALLKISELLDNWEIGYGQRLFGEIWVFVRMSHKAMVSPSCIFDCNGPLSRGSKEANLRPDCVRTWLL